VRIGTGTVKRGKLDLLTGTVEEGGGRALEGPARWRVLAPGRLNVALPRRRRRRAHLRRRVWSGVGWWWVEHGLVLGDKDGCIRTELDRVDTGQCAALLVELHGYVMALDVGVVHGLLGVARVLFAPELD
jgi:hypothetical protein